MELWLLHFWERNPRRTSLALNFCESAFRLSPAFALPFPLFLRGASMSSGMEMSESESTAMMVIFCLGAILRQLGAPGRPQEFG